MSEATIPIKELMEKTEQWLLGQGYKKSTLGFYRATWNRFLSYSASPAYSRETAEQFCSILRSRCPRYRSDS